MAASPRGSLKLEDRNTMKEKIGMLKITNVHLMRHLVREMLIITMLETIVLFD